MSKVSIQSAKSDIASIHGMELDEWKGGTEVCFLAVLRFHSCCVVVSVTTSTSVSQAISLVMENKGSFDIVISEVYLPGEDGFKLLDVVGVGLGLPVISKYCVPFSERLNALLLNLVVHRSSDCLCY